MKKKLFALALRLYVLWSTIYQKFERRFLKCEPIPKRLHVEICDDWSNLTRTLKHYGSDPWWKGFDVISAPERFLVTKKDDCDTFAFLAVKFFGKNIKIETTSYDFQGLYCLNYGLKGHVLAVWKRRGKESQKPINEKFLVVDNKDIYTVSKPEFFYESKTKMIGVIGYDFKKDKLYFTEVL